MGTAAFAQIISGFLGDLVSPQMTAAAAGQAVLSALLTALLLLGAELLTGEAEYHCTAKARLSLRRAIFSKALELDVGNIEKIGPVSAITSAVDGVEAMQVYYSKYLPGLLYCLAAPFYLFWRMGRVSLLPAAVLFLVSLVLLPVNNLFRGHIEKLKAGYWASMEDLTGTYLENVRGLSTFKLFGRDGDRQRLLEEKSQDFNRKVMGVMKVNFSSFLLTDGLIYASVAVAAVLAAGQLLTGELSFSGALMVLLLSFGFFGSVRQLMNATHSALAGVSAADKVEKLLDIDTARPCHPGLPRQNRPFDGIRLEHISFGYQGRQAALRDVSPGHSPGENSGTGGAFRQREVHHRQSAHAVLRPGTGPHPAGGVGLHLFPAGGAAKAGDFSASVGEPVLRHHCREPAHGRPQRHPWGYAGSPGPSAAGGLGPHPAPGIGHTGGGRRRQALRGPAAEAGHRPCSAVQGGVHHFRRSYLQRGHGERAGNLELHRGNWPRPGRWSSSPTGCPPFAAPM